MRLLNSKSTDLDWYYSRHYRKLKQLVHELLFITFVNRPPPPLERFCGISDASTYQSGAHRTNLKLHLWLRGGQLCQFTISITHVDMDVDLQRYSD